MQEYVQEGLMSMQNGSRGTNLQSRGRYYLQYKFVHKFLQICKNVNNEY